MTSPSHEFFIIKMRTLLVQKLVSNLPIFFVDTVLVCYWSVVSIDFPAAFPHFLARSNITTKSTLGNKSCSNALKRRTDSLLIGLLFTVGHMKTTIPVFSLIYDLIVLYLFFIVLCCPFLCRTDGSKIKRRKCQ